MMCYYLNVHFQGQRVNATHSADRSHVRANSSGDKQELSDEIRNMYLLSPVGMRSFEFATGFFA